MEDLKDQIKEMDDDVYLSDLKEEVESLVVWGTVKELAEWEEILAKRE